MNEDDIAAAQLIIEQMAAMGNFSFGYFKRETEKLIGKKLFAAEAQELYHLAGGGSNG